MELNDCAFPLLNSIKGATDYQAGFIGCNLAILVGAKPRGPGMQVIYIFYLIQRSDLLSANA
jgi:hypothetical protein